MELFLYSANSCQQPVIPQVNVLLHSQSTDSYITPFDVQLP